MRSDWRIKLREDAQKVAELEDQRGDGYDIFVFVTSQRVTCSQWLQTVVTTTKPSKTNCEYTEFDR